MRLPNFSLVSSPRTKFISNSLEKSEYLGFDASAEFLGVIAKDEKKFKFT